MLAIVVTFTAVAAWGNDRFVKLPSAIGVMLAGVCVAAFTLAASALGWVDGNQAKDLVNSLHFDTLLLAGHGTNAAGQGILLGILLFAAALQIEPTAVTKRFGLIIWLATIGVVLTAIGTAAGFQLLLWLDGGGVDFVLLILFGAILAPTDPVAALSLLRQTSAPGRVREVIAGESLFNDGISIVLFLFLLAVITGNTETPFEGRWMLGFVVETGGAIVAGVVLGLVGRLFVATSRKASVIVMVSLAVVLSIGVLAPAFYISCPVACVVAGLIMGRSRSLAQQEGRMAVSFWGLIEQSLTAMLFLMIGLELLVVTLTWSAVLWSLAVIPILIAVRFIALLVPWFIAKLIGRTTISIEEVLLMTWCGLRGGVSIAMAIAVPTTIMLGDGTSLRSHALLATIIVVIGSILIQGLTVDRLSRMVQRRTDRRAAAAAA